MSEQLRKENAAVQQEWTPEYVHELLGFPNPMSISMRWCYEKIADAHNAALTAANNLLELAWGVIANAGGGDWEKESKEWQDAAVRWRDSYFGSLRSVSKESSEQPNTNRPPNPPSEQPQKWTPEWLDSRGIDGVHARRVLCEWHNAALAAAYEKGKLDAIRDETLP